MLLWFYSDGTTAECAINDHEFAGQATLNFKFGWIYVGF